MRTIAKLGAVVAAGALAVAVPAAAKNHPPTSHKCAPHKVAYTASGTLVSWNATKSGKSYTGTITVKVTHANRHAGPQKGTTYTYTLSNARASFAKRANPPAAGDHVVVTGTITTVAKKCTDQSGAGKIAVRKVDVTPPAKK